MITAHTFAEIAKKHDVNLDDLPMMTDHVRAAFKELVAEIPGSCRAEIGESIGLVHDFLHASAEMFLMISVWTKEVRAEQVKRRLELVQ
jgi:hypothetical protein